METRKSKIEKLLKSEVNFYFMYSESGIMYFRNESQISEEEYMMADRSAPRKDMPLFFDAEVQEKYNLITLKKPANNTENTRNERR